MKKSRLLNAIAFCMKLIAIQIVLSATFTLAVFAKKAEGQGVLDKLITLDIKNEEVKNVITEIKKKTEVEFIFSSTSIQANRKISIKANDTKLKYVLDEIVKSLGIAYKVVNEQVLLYKIDGDNVTLLILEPAGKKDPSSVSGVVTNAVTNEALTGASVTVKGKKKTVTTNNEGKFTIDAQPGDVLVVSYVGYATQEMEVKADGYYAIALKVSDANLSNITVIGSRGKPRTDVERPVPVDVFSAKDIQKTGQVELAQMIHFSAPSFNSTKHGISNVTSYVDPATLRGLGPDQTLVLVNGKRRHQSAALNVNNVVGRGSVGTDLNVIPTGAIERVEILRDGAAAQYGSDAIAGIINLQLKRNASGGSVTGQYGVTKEGDGRTYEQSVNFGLPLGKKGGFFNTTLQFHHNDPTDRSAPYTARVYNSNQAIDDSIIAARKFNRQIGGTKYGLSKNTTAIVFYNAELPLQNNWALYSFGGYSNKDVTAYGFFRPPSNAKRRVLNIYPNGYSPVFPANLQDISTSVGFKKKSIGGWNMDFSNTYGRNHITLYSNTTVNPSYGDASPTSFFGGDLIFNQNSTNADFSRSFTNIKGINSLNLSFGAEMRMEHYQINQGDDPSWRKGSLQNTDVGASGREGFADVNAVSKNRSNIGLYTDVESDITDKLLLSAALRFENYSDFGANLSGKFSARYKLSNNFSIRGSVNRGFRAPSMHQLYYSNNADAQWLTINGVFDAYPIGHLRNDNKYVQQLGVGNLKAETSLDFNAGFTLQVARKWLMTVDAYQIDINNRVAISAQLDATTPAMAPIFNGSGYALVQFFSNALDTRTKGLDIVTTYTEKFAPDHELILNGALMLNETKLKGNIRTPDKLASVGNALVDRVTLGLIEVAQPRNKMILSANYRYKKIEGLLRATRFGEVTARQSDPANDQTFGAKVITDASLTWHINPRISWSIGGNNIGNVYPDKIALASLTGSGQTPYTRFTSQFGFMGAYYYTSVRIGF
ncbi:TonB-dependent receptor [Sediminibacterium soli]|uniref:TonB-dependent receptor n=1 Tax=Sediminibacterium soli TaxID=2698829 RepID=UPI001379FC2B|nr:TonB-dependent receptor [Sediminibacterium soli]NCI48139.1 TonB-dependent receptor [Sediminibacterium soli]